MYFYKCKSCNREIKYESGVLKRVYGYCKTCAPKFVIAKPKNTKKRKKCIKCNKILSINKFGKTGSNHPKSSCLKCCNLSKFGINSSDWDKMFLKQNGKCAICKKAEKAKTNSGKIMNLAVDHDHKTGKIRGLLCGACNQGIGLLKEKISLFESAISYLKEHNESKI